MITNDNIDHGKAFDWGLASADYARYRDIYPEEFYEKILPLGLCVKGQKVLDLGGENRRPAAASARPPCPTKRKKHGNAIISPFSLLSPKHFPFRIMRRF